MDGIDTIDLSIYKNEKGNVLKGFLKSQHNDFDVQEVYFSEIVRGEIKGWKKHNEMTCNLVVPKGAVRFVILNQDNQTDHYSIVISRSNYKMLKIPPGHWFAFQGIQEDLSLIVNITDLEHDELESQEKDINSFYFNWS
jgi:dTDP-4-dehydrorhamnose 3,5-epimerase|tara:strand:- start:1805 stop:2221 length:417 start_codon:yes stop_codon:yes gene_type:complete